MRAPEAIAVELKGTSGDWTATVLAIGSPAHVQAAAATAASSIKSGEGIACTYSTADYSAAGLMERNKILEAAKAAKAAEPAAIEGRIKATATVAEMKAAELTTAETKAAEIVAKARAADLSAKAALTAAKASKPAAPAKKAAKAKKAVKKAGRRRK